MTAPTGPPGDWHVAAASQVGSVHVRDHRPCQDAAAVWTDGARAVVAVADGHGHRDHFRSDVGAELAVDAALEVLRGHLDATDAADAAGGAGAVDAGRLAAEIVARWRERVGAHAAAHPWPAGDSAPGSDGLRPYGTTLVAVAVVGGVVVVLQVGDGDVVVVDGTGRAHRPLPDDPALDGVRTHSLCQPDPLSGLRSAVLAVGGPGEPGIALVYLCTDGFGVARVETDWWRTTGEQLHELTRRHGVDWVAERLPGWLEEPARVGGDDTTLALLVRG